LGGELSVINPEIVRRMGLSSYVLMLPGVCGDIREGGVVRLGCIAVV